MIHKTFLETMALYWKMKNKTIFFLFRFYFLCFPLLVCVCRFLCYLSLHRCTGSVMFDLYNSDSCLLLIV